MTVSLTKMNTSRVELGGRFYRVSFLLVHRFNDLNQVENCFC